MNKYELAVVVNAKIEDEERAQVIEKVKEMITRFGGNVTDVDEWGKRRLAYEIQKMKEAYYYFVHFEAASDVYKRQPYTVLHGFHQMCSSHGIQQAPSQAAGLQLQPRFPRRVTYCSRYTARVPAHQAPFRLPVLQTCGTASCSLPLQDTALLHRGQPLRR